jgi:hypothetical protein
MVGDVSWTEPVSSMKTNTTLIFVAAAAHLNFISFAADVWIPISSSSLVLLRNYMILHSNYIFTFASTLTAFILVVLL